jgi:hypothetical protein
MVFKVYSDCRMMHVNHLSLKEEACEKAFYFKENSQEENLD